MADILKPVTQPTRPPFVVVAGAPRSGTYLMVTHLEQHFSVATPLETHFIPLFNTWKFLWGDLSDKENRRVLVDDIFVFLEIWARASRVDAPEMAEFNLLTTREHAQQVIDHASSYAEIVQTLFRCYADLHQKQLAGEKSAFYSLIPLAKTAECFGESVRVLHIVRDGRDVARSWMSMWTGPETLTAAALLWKGQVRQKRQWGASAPDHYLEVRYEDLLSDPVGCNSKISEFLGVPVSAAEHQRMSDILSSLPTHQKISGGLKQNNSLKWRSEMSVGEQKLFEYYAADVLAEFSYEQVGFTYTLADRCYYAALRAGAAIRRVFSMKRWKNRIKTILPPLIWLARKVGLKSLLIRLAT